jgi:hypothetical protein
MSERAQDVRLRPRPAKTRLDTLFSILTETGVPFDAHRQGDKMANAGRSRLPALLAFVAAVLAAVAAGIAYARRRELKWSLLAAALFLAAMGWSALKRGTLTFRSTAPSRRSSSFRRQVVESRIRVSFDMSPDQREAVWFTAPASTLGRPVRPKRSPPPWDSQRRTSTRAAPFRKCPLVFQL